MVTHTKKVSQEQNESHDWFADAAESLVRYYYAKEGHYVYGASKWGSDCVIQSKDDGKMLTVEVKSTDRYKSSTYLIKSLKKKLKKMSFKTIPDIYAAVRLKKAKDIKDRTINIELEISFKEIDKKKRSLKDDLTRKNNRDGSD